MITARPTGKRNGEYFGEGYSFRRLAPLPDDCNGKEFKALLRRLYWNNWYASHRAQVRTAQSKRRADDLADPARAEKRRSSERATASRYAKRHPDRVKAFKKRWDAANREHRLAYAREYNKRYYAKNAERIKAHERTKREARRAP